MTERPIFEPRRLAEYTDEAIFEELRRIATLGPNSALTSATIKAHGRIGMTTINRRFGTLLEALRAAGLINRSCKKIKTLGSHPSRSMSNEEVLEELRGLSQRLGRDTLTKADVNQNLLFSDKTLRKRWGSTRAALEAAGLVCTRLGRRYQDEECFTNMLAVWTHHGRPPTRKEMCEPPSTVGAKAYVLRFGTWGKALTAFAEHVNRDRVSDSPEALVEQPVNTIVVEAIRPSENRRDIRLGLRFRVLNRDKFKCVLCGEHPARNAECVLHVDHIFPWSRGGKTREDNLRTLCATCNVGRGNRLFE